MILAIRAKKGSGEARQWIDSLAKRRSEEASAVLRADCNAQWKAGNRGDFGDWREVAEAKA